MLSQWFLSIVSNDDFVPHCETDDATNATAGRENNKQNKKEKK